MLKKAWHLLREGLDPKGGHQGSSRLAGGRGALGRTALCNKGYFRLGRVYGMDRAWMAGAAPALYHKSKQHLLVIGGSRAGKGTRVLIPAILDHPGVSVVHCPKGESTGITAESLARRGYKVCIVDPFDQAAKFIGDRSLDKYKVDYNPLADINPFDQSSEIMIQALSKVLIKEDKTSNAGPYWTAVNRQVAQGLMAWATVDWTQEQVDLMMSKPPSEFTLMEKGLLAQHNNLVPAAHFNQMSNDDLINQVKMMFNYDQTKTPAYDPNMPNFVDNLIINGGRNALLLMNESGGDADGMRSFLTTFSNEFAWAKSRAMQESLAGFDFKFRMADLKKQEKMVVFLVVPKYAMETVRPWLRMFFAQALTTCEVNPGVPKYPINLIIDEGPQLGHVPEIEQAFAMSAGQGVRVVYVCQDLSQLQEHYGTSWETIIGNSAQIVLSVGDNKTCDYFSVKAGKTYQKDQKTKKKSEEKVDVFTPDEIAKQTHPDRECGIYFENGANAQKFAAIDYFKDKSRRAGRDYRVHPDHDPKKRKKQQKSPALSAPEGTIALEDHRRRRNITPKKRTKRLKKAS